MMRVLLAEKRVWLRAALRLFLEEVPTINIVGEVADAEALLRFTAIQRPDLILLDATLPRPPRFATLRQCVSALRACHPSVYIIVLYANHEKHDDMRATGANAWVSKAETPDRLLVALHQAAAFAPVDRLPAGVPCLSFESVGKDTQRRALATLGTTSCGENCTLSISI
jgi:DNA-binding NarL/FixJ family response regulator